MLFHNKRIVFLNVSARVGSDTLQKLSVPVVCTKDCRAALKSIKTPILDDANLCAGGLEGFINIEIFSILIY